MKPHVAFLPSPGMGHIIPLFQLAKSLVFDHGFQISFFVITTHSSAAQDQFTHSASELSPDLRFITLPEADVSNFNFQDMRLLTHICVITRESIKPLKPMLIDLNPVPVALIIDIFTTDAIEICEELSIPVYSFFTASTPLLALSLYIPTLDREVEGEFIDLPAPVEIPGCKAIRTVDLLDQVKDRKNDDYKWFLIHVTRLRCSAGILVNSWENLDVQRITALKQDSFFRSIPTPPLFPIGPLIKAETLTEKDDEILAWLDNQPSESVLFASLGSGGTLSSKQLIELALGLEMSEQKFILVVRKPTDVSAYGTYFTVGSDEDDPSAYLPDGFLERNRGVGVVVHSWAPQLAVLRHGSTGAFLSHCGWNSVLESLVEGVPLIAWPMYAEQRMNAIMLVEEVGVAVKAAAGEIGEVVVGRKEIETVVREVMKGEKGKMMRRRAAELKRSANEALESGGSSHRSLSLLVDIWKSDVKLLHNNK